MKSLHAPWRLAVLENYKKTEGCILCGLHSSDPAEDRANLILMRSPSSFLLMNRFPYSNGHLMVVPQRHVSDWKALTDVEILDMNRLMKMALSVLEQEVEAQGFNLGTNLGEVAGAGIPDHLHWHIVPRWKGDTNFMPLFAEVRVISEHLEATYDKLKRSLDQLAQKLED